MKRIKTNKKRNRFIKKNVTLKRKSRRKNNTAKRCLKRGGGEKEKKESALRDEFRNMFLKAFKKLQDAVKSGNQEQLNKAVESFINGFQSNQTSINTLIPVINNTPVNKYNQPEGSPVEYFVPLLVLIFENIDDPIIRKTLIKNFIKCKGNINLKSYTKDITALSSAIELQDKDLVKFLIENGADIKILTDEQKDAFDALMKEEEIIEPPTPEKLIVKLDLQLAPPSDSGYDNRVEPEFWKPIFGENELLKLREKINNMMNADGNIPITNKEATELWSVCKINQSIIPTYFTPTKNDPYELFGNFIIDQDLDFSHYNIVLCSALIVFGIISYKMIGQDYKLIFKGGKAIQLVLAGIPETSTYKSEDIDILLLPDTNVPYDEFKIKNLAGHISYLVRWFLNTPETQYKVSVQAPNPQNTRANPFIFKLSYVKVNQKRDYRKQIMVDDFRQFSDIDFKQIPDNIKVYFERSIEFPFYISELNENVLFVCPNIGSLLDEKIYYYVKYTEFKKLLQEGKTITEPGLTIFDCERFLEKFKRAILAMNTGLQKQRFPGILPDELMIKERTSIMSRLNKLGFTNEVIKKNVIDSLYPSDQSKP